MSTESGITTQATLTNTNDACTIYTLNCGSVGVQLTGTWTGTVTFEATVDGTNWASINAVAITGGAAVTTATGNGQWFIDAAGMSQVRARFSTASSPSVVATLGTTVASSATVVGTVTVNTPFSTAAALADSTVNPTTSLAGSLMEAWNGASWDRVRTPKTFTDVSTVTISTITTVWTPAGGKKIRLMGGSISSNTAVSVLFEDNSSGNTVFRTPVLLVATPYNFDLGNGKLLSTADHVLKATGSNTSAITGTLWGTEE